MLTRANFPLVPYAPVTYHGIPSHSPCDPEQVGYVQNIRRLQIMILALVRGLFSARFLFSTIPFTINMHETKAGILAQKLPGVRGARAGRVLVGCWAARALGCQAGAAARCLPHRRLLRPMRRKHAATCSARAAISQPASHKRTTTRGKKAYGQICERCLEQLTGLHAGRLAHRTGRSARTRTWLVSSCVARSTAPPVGGPTIPPAHTNDTSQNSAQPRLAQLQTKHTGILALPRSRFAPFKI